MKKNDLARRLAREARLSQAQAADQLDEVINRILKRLRNGKPAALPGLGTFLPGGKPGFEFDPDVSGGRKR